MELALNPSWSRYGMSGLSSIRIYEGAGRTLKDRGKSLPDFNPDLRQHRPGEYVPNDKLLDAVNVALTLGMPLLLTGEPGTGKTDLAHSVAWELGLGEPEVFHTKSTSTYTDLFYQYDALRHFRDAQMGTVSRNAASTEPAIKTENYLSFGSLGRAILLAMSRSDPNTPTHLRNVPQRRSVVLIDELDKAPRDFPNDILNEIDRMSFQVNELPPERRTFIAEPKYRPIVILTSNLEKDLPDAFRRRCVFYHINFDDLDLVAIARRRLSAADGFNDDMLRNAIQHFKSLRVVPGLDKLPATAELLDWLRLLQRLNLDLSDPTKLGVEERLALAASYSVLAKSDDDIQKLRLAGLESFPKNHRVKS